MNDRERDALIAFARMLNSGDVEGFLKLTSEDFRYASQSVFKEIESREEYRAYIEAKLQTIRKYPEARVYAELAKTDAWGHDHCVLLAQGSKDQLVATVFLKIEREWVVRADLCLIPAPQSVDRTGVYPGLEC